VDTHAHLCDPVFDSDRAAVIERARDAGVSVIFAVGENLADAKLNIDLAEKYPELRPAAGLYPSHLDINQAEALTAFIRKEKNNLIAIGEVGLDFWLVKDEPQKDIQRKIFSDFIELSIELGLPLNDSGTWQTPRSVERMGNLCLDRDKEIVGVVDKGVWIVKVLGQVVGGDH